MKRKYFMTVTLKEAFLFLILFTISSISLGQGLPIGNPEKLGLSPERLSRIDTVMNDYVKNGKMPGMVAMVIRHGKVGYFKSFGFKNIEEKKPMTNDAIFRIASMTKAITSVAVMTLYEQGYFLLTDPVSKFIPEFKNPKVVMKSPTSDSVILVPAKNEITIRELLNHTSGITYGSALQERYYQQAGMTVGLLPTEGTIGDMIKKLGPLPLISQPGEEFHYGMSVDVLGYLIEVVSKMPLDEFMRKYIFEPLKMQDTYFTLPSEKFSRLATLYIMGSDSKLEKVTKYFPYPEPQHYYSGGAGLVSTATDYARFAQMILNKGELNGIRILSRKTVELMTTNSIGDLYIFNPFKHNGIMGDKFGYGFGIRTERGTYDELESIGTFGWDGAFYTRFWIDPKEDLIGIFLSQVDNYWSENLIGKFKNLVYQSINH
ncbi:MAG: serine hydrolase domain-containing protein [Bacteroidales bacterium]|jgi:CubicO group peptidase (beta-lactamase class C family)